MFLEDISTKFVNSLGPLIDNANTEMILDSKFKPILKRQIEYFNTNPSCDNITHVRNQLEDVKVVMLNNIDKLFERDDKLYSLLGKTEELNQDTIEFKKGAVQLKHTMMWKRVRCSLFVIVILLVYISIF